MRNLVLAIDCGTSGMRGLIYDEFGKEIVSHNVDFNGYYSLKPGWLEAPAAMFWDALCEITKNLKTKSIDAFSAIIGMTVTCQRDTGTLLDENGEAMRDFIIWKDRRLLDKPVDIPKKWQAIFTMVGKKAFVESFNKGTHAHWIKVNEPKLWKKAKYYSFLSGYLFGKLTGNVVDTVSNMAGHINFNFKKKRWCGDHEIIAQIIRIEKEKLPLLKKSCEVLGIISKKASADTGLRIGLPVVSSGTDKGCETLGVGCISPRQASVSLGTQATIETTTEVYYELVKFFPPFPAVQPNAFNPEITVYSGCWLLQWYLDNFGQYDRYYCEQNGINLFEYLEKQISSVPAGSKGLVLHPYWGIELFKPEASGSIIGFNEHHTKETVLRSIVEGIGYALKEGIEAIENKSGVQFEKIGLSGGGSQNETICQIMADIFGIETYKVQTYATSGLGAAMAVYMALGHYRSFEEVNEKMVHTTKVFKPNPENHQIYQEIYSGVYKKAFKSYKPIYKELKRIQNKLI